MKSVQESFLNNIKELNKELLAVKEQCKELDRINKELSIEKENLNDELNDRSIVVGHEPPLELNLFEQQTPIDLLDKVC